MRAGIYLRISQDQAKQGEQDREAGVKRQLQDCEKLAADLKWDVARIFTDNDASATGPKVREQYREMLADIEAGRIDAVVAWHTDRLYRRLADLEELAKVCDKYNVAVRTCRSGELDMSTPTGRMIARILGSVATYEVEQKADRWLRSIRQRREAGRWWNSASRMFGYTRDGKLIDAEADALRRAVADILSGGTIFSACRLLNSEGWRTTRGNEWQPTTLRTTLRSPKIAGLSALGGQIIGPGNWEPILDRDTWERVVARLAPGYRLGPTPRRALLTGLAFCGVEGCGRQLRRGPNRDGPAYRCKTELRSSRHVTISGAALEAMVEAAARAKLSDERVRKAVAARLAGADTRAGELTREIDDIEAEITELDHALREAGDRSKLSIARAIDDLDTRLAAKRQLLGALTPVVIPADDEWPDDIDRRSALIGLVVARVEVMPAKRPGGPFDHTRVRIVPLLPEQT